MKGRVFEWAKRSAVIGGVLNEGEGKSYASKFL